MKQTASSHELHHEIFGSILDRIEMTPFLLLPAVNYETALRQATKMMGNRGFDTHDDELQESEKERARKYIEKVCTYFIDWMFPFFKKPAGRALCLALCQLRALPELHAGHRRDRIDVGEYGVSNYGR
jgi:hypothetical protein